MKKKGKISKIIKFLVLLILLSTSVQAKSSMQAKLESNREELKQGEEITISLKLDEYQEINKGINAYKATLEYDKNIFEEVTQINFISQNNWEQLKYNKNTGEFVAIKKAGSKVSEEVVKITLKARENIVAGKTDIKLLDLVTSEGKKDIEIAQETNITVDIIDKQEINPPITPEEPNTPEEGPNIPENPNGNVGGKEETENDKLSGKLPNTGDSYWKIYVIIAVEILIVFAYINRKKGKHIEKQISQNKKMFISILITGLISAQLIGTIYATVIDYTSKGELSGDKKVDYYDVELLEMHLINLKYLQQNNLENADMNDDGKITVTDLTLLVQKLEKSLDYEVNIEDAGQNTYYPSKNDEIILKFIGNVNYGATIDKVTINNIEYNVNKLAEENTYEVNVGKVNEAGIKQYHFTQANLDNGKNVKIDKTIKLDVLKDIPTIENYSVEEDINNSKVNIKFNLKDNDKSITTSKISIINKEDNNLIHEQSINSGENSIEIPVKDGEKYKVNFIIHYDLDTNELVEMEENHTGSFEQSKDLEFIINYDWKISDIATYREDGNKTTTFNKNDKIKIKFKSSNSTKFEPSTLKVNGKEYNVTKEGILYTVILDEISNIGNTTITVEELTLSNGKKFKVETQNIIEIKILKQKPEVLNFESKENLENNTLETKFTLKDEDNSIKTTYIELFNANGTKLDEKEISIGNNNLTLKTEITSRYIIKVIATYNLGEEDKNNQIIFEKNIEAKPRTQITKVTTDKNYIEKQENVLITYTISTNKTENIKYIRINNKDCIATKKNANTYQVNYGVQATNSGIYELKTTKVIYSNQEESDVNNITKIEILKEAPTVSEIEEEDNINDGKVTLKFNINDTDNAFINGKAVLTKQENNSKQEQEIQKDANKIEFNVEENKIYTLEIIATYDRDSNALEETDKNLIKDKVIKTTKIELIADYKLQINNIETYKDETKTKYFEKGNQISIRFASTNISIFEPVKAIINNKEYELNKKGNLYETKLDIDSSLSGIKEIAIERIILSNNKELEVSEKNKTKVEILKTVPTINDFKYSENENNEMIISFKVKDNDNAIKLGNVIILDENGGQIATKNIIANDNEICFKKSNSESYVVKVIANYDLDTNTITTGENEYNNTVLMQEKISTSNRRIEMKDIENILLYGQNGEQLTKIDVKDLSNLKDYVVKLEMKDLPTFYSMIKEYKIENNVLKFILDYENAIQYDGEQKRNYIEVEYGPIEEGIAKQSSLSLLVEQIKNNPYGNYEIVSDLDASKITEGQAIILDTFYGTLEGNGHTIKNLSRPLFNSLSGANIKNLKITNSNMTAYAVLTKEMRDTDVKNVHFKNITLKAAGRGTGILAGNVTQKSVIEECSATDVTVGTAKIIGGFIGQMENSTIKNSYISRATVSSNADGCGGFIGETLSGVTVENCYANVTTNYSNPGGSRGGLIGNPVNTILNNNLSLATSMSGEGKGFRIFGRYVNNISNSSKNNYELESSNLSSNASHSSVDTVNEETLKTKEFYTKTLKWDENIWNFDNVIYGQYPTLKNADPNNAIEGKPSNEKLYIPEYSRLKKLDNYDSNKEIMYHNLYKLMPFDDAKYLLIEGSKINKEDILNTNIIKYILPLNKNNQLITGIEKEKDSSISKIRVVFDNDSSKDYTVIYKNTINNSIMNYEIQELKIKYQYNHYRMNIDKTLKNEIIQKASSYKYDSVIASITQEVESRLYNDYYNETVKPKMEEVMSKYIMTYMSYSNINSEVLQTKIKKDLNDEEQLKRFLYAYNYYNKWYCIDLDGIMISDLLLFLGDEMYEQLDIEYLISSLLNTTPENRSINTSRGFFENFIKNKVGMNLETFLPHLFKVINGYDDPSDWIVAHFDGILHEQPAIGEYSDKIEYRIWPMMVAKQFSILPILTAPQEDMYLISCPSQLIIGSMNRYTSYLNKDGKERERMKASIKEYAEYLGRFYGTSAGFIPDSVNKINNITNMQFDTRFNFPASSKADKGTQEKEQTREPVMKWVYEPMGKWAAANGHGAYANGSDVWWVVESVLGNISYSVSVFTHETAHNQDHKYFYSGAGRRNGTGAEAHSNGVIAQNIGEETVTFNLIKNSNITDDITTNLTFDRVNTAEKIHSYYREMYETKYVLEYIAGQAFLKLTPEEQAKVAVQVQHPTTGLTYNTEYKKLSAEDFRKMKLTKIEDLWDNKIAIRGAGVSANAQEGDYDSESFYNLYFYIPANENGVSDSKTFKRVGYEMLGYAGYDKGFINFMSLRTKNDLEALKKITGNNNITWKQYKMNRYENVEKNLNNIKYYDINELRELYVTALKKDAQNNNLNTSVAVTKLYYGIMKRATNDFTTGGIYNNPKVTSITTAKQFIDLLEKNPLGNYRIDADLDFSNIKAVDGKNYYINNTFIGTLNGNGHKLTGIQYTLFNNITYADIKNMVIEKPEYGNSVNAYLALSSKNVLIHNILVKEANKNIANITTKNKLIFTLGNNELTLKSNKISSIEDFLAIDTSNETRAQQYELTADLDFSKYTANKEALITGNFTGVIKGNGHTISNLKNATLFANINGGTVENLKIKDFSNTRNVDTVTAFANNTNKATIRNMKFENITLKGTHRTAVVVAVDNSGSVFEKISVKNANVIGSGFYVSTFIGRKYGGKIKDCYVEGDLEIYKTDCGGLIGALQSGGEISNTITKVNINRTKSTDNRNNNGGLIGNISNNPVIKNSISLGNMTGFTQGENEINVPKFIGCTEEMIKSCLTNCYEVKDTTGQTSVTENTSGKLDEILSAEIHKVEFYKDRLNFDESIWNLNNITANGHPELR